jgi:hypothetical protein
LNRTLATNCEDYPTPAYYIRGINASALSLSIMKEYSTSSKVLNFRSINASSSSFTGDLLFTIGNTAYDLQGTDIIVPEFTSNFVLVALMISMCFLALIVRKRKLYARH